MIVELNRRLVKGYTHYKDDPRIASLKKAVLAYNKKLWLLGIWDHQVEYAKFSVIAVVGTLIYRLGKLAVMAVGTLPGLVLFAPVFIASKIISIKKSREALAASTVKLQGRDVMATWKLLVAMGLAPLLYAFYTALLTYWTYRNRIQGLMPEWLPLWMVVTFGMVFFPSITFAALRFGETGMDIFKSLRPLVLSLNPTSANTLVKVRQERKRLSAEVTDVINTLGPEMFPDFDHARIVADPFRDSGSPPPTSPRSPRHPRRTPPRDNTKPTDQETPRKTPRSPTDASIGGGSSAQGHLPRNESFGNLGDISLFASRPPSRSRSRTSSGAGLDGGGFTLGKGFSAISSKDSSTISSKESLDEVSKKIRGAMQERGVARRRRSEASGTDGSGSWDFGEIGSVTPGSEEEGKKGV